MPSPCSDSAKGLACSEPETDLAAFATEAAEAAAYAAEETAEASVEETVEASVEGTAEASVETEASVEAASAEAASVEVASDAAAAVEIVEVADAYSTSLAFAAFSFPPGQATHTCKHQRMLYHKTHKCVCHIFPQSLESAYRREAVIVETVSRDATREFGPPGPCVYGRRYFLPGQLANEPVRWTSFCVHGYATMEKIW